jgi:hypothetical protein
MRARSLAGRAMACSLLVAGVLPADDARKSLGGEKARITLAMHMTPLGGATSRVTSLGPLDLAAGEETWETAFAAGSSESGCSMTMNIEGRDKLVAEYPLVWTASVEVLAVSTDSIVLSSSWERWTAGPDGKPQRIGGEPATKLTLREGDRVLLDYADRAPSGSPLCMRNFSLELTAGVAEDPTLVDRQLRYDIWLVHAGPGGEKSTHHVGIAAAQGQKIPFRFDNAKIRPQGAAPGEWLWLGVEGAVRGRVRGDGTVDLSIEGFRRLAYGSAEEPEGGTAQGTDKILNVQPGEAVRIELAGAPKNGDPLYARDLGGHSFGLILTAKSSR